MNATTKLDDAAVKLRTKRLVKRAAALGLVSATGAPMGDHIAFELIAAEEGFRNQHAMRATFDKTAPAQAADTAMSNFQTAQAKLEVHRGIAAVIARMGWSGESVRMHLETFVGSQGLMPQYLAYLESKAADEEGFSDEAAPVDLLKELGFTVQLSETYYKPYWAHDGHDAASTDFGGSEDFDTEAQAWADAWDSACELAAQLFGLTVAQITALAEATRDAILKTAFDVADEQEAADAHEARWGSEHPFYPRSEWRADVDNRDTTSGYWEWVHYQVATHGGLKDHNPKTGSPKDAERCDEVASTVVSVGRPEAELLAEQLGVDLDDVGEWVGMHYQRHFPTETPAKKLEWVERYQEAHSADEGSLQEDADRLGINLEDVKFWVQKHYGKDLLKGSFEQQQDWLMGYRQVNGLPPAELQPQVSPEVLADALKALSEKAAQAAFAKHSFGKTVAVEGSCPWEWAEDGKSLSKSVHVCDSRRREVSLSVTFKATVANGQVVKTEVVRPALDRDTMRRLADAQLEGYDFGEHFTVAGRSGWLWLYELTLDNEVLAVTLEQAVYLEDDRTPDAPTTKKTFRVNLVGGSVNSLSCG